MKKSYKNTYTYRFACKFNNSFVFPRFVCVCIGYISSLSHVVFQILVPANIKVLVLQLKQFYTDVKILNERQFIIFLRKLRLISIKVFIYFVKEKHGYNQNSFMIGNLDISSITIRVYTGYICERKFNQPKNGNCINLQLTNKTNMSYFFF